MAEMLEIFDPSFHSIGVESRHVAHEQGLWHQTFQCWLIRKRNDKCYVLFQKRSNSKKDFPGLLDIPAAGHICAGETKEDGLRELEEELGIRVAYDSLRYLGVRTEVLAHPGFDNREFQHVYLLENHTPLQDFTLQPEEVAGLVEVELSDGLRLLYGETDEICCNAVFLEDGQNRLCTYLLHREDMIFRVDGYYKKIFIMAQRYFSGEKYLSI